MATTTRAVKRLLLERPRQTREARYQLLPRWMALPAFSANPLSSLAYAPQEMVAVVALAGMMTYGVVGGLAVAVIALLAIAVANQRQTVRAYPGGGGPYIVARDNLGDVPGLVAAAALLVTYVLTVAVSIAAGVQAVVALAPEVAAYRVPLALLALAIATVLSLRSSRSAGLLFVVPTYAFLVSIAVVVVVGLARCAAAGCPPAPSPGVVAVPDPSQGLAVLVVLWAFALGAGALGGMGAVANGAPLLRIPQRENAAAIVAITGVLAGAAFLGLSALAVGTGVGLTGPTERTAIAQITIAVLGSGPALAVVQLSTVAILLLAVHSAYTDVPRLVSVLARDRWLPRHLLSRGDRLAFSNTMLLIALAGGVLLTVVGVDVTALVPLYVVAVATAFALSHAGMARRHVTRRPRGWRVRAALNAAGAGATLVVALVALAVSFTGGGWAVLVGIALLSLGMHRIRTHYREVSLRLQAGLVEPTQRLPNHAVILLDRVDEAAARALSYVRASGPSSICALGVPLAGADLDRRWEALAPDVPLQVLQPATSRGVVDALASRLDELDRSHGPGSVTTAVIPETLSRSWVEQVLEHRLALRVKTRLQRDGRIVVTDITSPEGGPGPYTVEEPTNHHVVVLLSGVNAATRRALAYAQALQPTSTRALAVSLGAGRASELLAQWQAWDFDVPLEVVDSPFRSLSMTVRDYVRAFLPDGRTTVVTCVFPQLVLDRWYHRPLHNQSALLLRGALLFERGVATTSVPYVLPTLGKADARDETAPLPG